jgi:hypothetical protein
MGETKPARRDDRDALEPLIFTVREHRVLLDADLGRVYGTTTKALNQAVKRNRARFPADFAFQLTAAEAAVLRSAARGNPQVTDEPEDIRNRSQIVTGSRKHRDPRIQPWVYTEHGALMAANVLRSRQAVQMSVYVVRAFVRLRERLAANNAILKRLAEIDRTLLAHDAALRDVYQKLIPLLQPEPDPPRRSIGFHD